MRYRLCLYLTVFLLLSCSESSKKRTGGDSFATDDLGRTIRLAPSPQRIVSLAPSITETLYALGTDSSVVGVTDYCDFPPAARSKPKVGGMINPNLERIVELKPDLIVMSVSGNIKTDFEKLESLGFRIFVTNPKDIEGVYKSIGDLGTLTGRRAIAASIIDSLRAQQDSLAQIASRHESTSVLVLLSLHPVIAAGPGTFLDELIKLANGRNIAADAGTSYPVLSREEILKRRPDVIIAMNDIAKSEKEIIDAHPEWRSLPAVTKRNIAILNADLISRPGPRIIKGLEQFVHSLYHNN